METRIGEWYLCEGYIEEPVRVEALDPWRIQVRYLTTGRTRWLGYPRIWHACKPHALPYEPEFDDRNRVVVLATPGSEEEPLRLNLNQLRSRFLPNTSKPRRAEARPVPPRAVVDDKPAWDDAVPWEGAVEEVSDDDETDFELDMSY
jgi:hypothetical protein